MNLTSDHGQKLEPGDRCRHGIAKDGRDVVDFAGGDDQWRQEAHYAALAPTQFQNQAALQAFALHQRRQPGKDRRMPQGIQLAWPS